MLPFPSQVRLMIAISIMWCKNRIVLGGACSTFIAENLSRIAKSCIVESIRWRWRSLWRPSSTSGGAISSSCSCCHWCLVSTNVSKKVQELSISIFPLFSAVYSRALHLAFWYRDCAHGKAHQWRLEYPRGAFPRYQEAGGGLRLVLDAVLCRIGAPGAPPTPEPQLGSPWEPSLKIDFDIYFDDFGSLPFFWTQACGYERHPCLVEALIMLSNFSPRWWQWVDALLVCANNQQCFKALIIIEMNIDDALDALFSFLHSSSPYLGLCWIYRWNAGVAMRAFATWLLRFGMNLHCYPIAIRGNPLTSDVKLLCSSCVRLWLIVYACFCTAAGWLW